MSNKLASTTAAQTMVPSVRRPLGVAEPRDLSVLRTEQPVEHHTGYVQAPSVSVSSPGGELSFTLAHGPGGVHVARTYRRGDRTKLHCSAMFQDQKAFLEWLDADDMRFTHPLVFQQLKRSFVELTTKREIYRAIRG